MSGFRLPSGGLIERDVPLAFTFDGKPLTGCKGDTVASALIANGISLMGRSFKYHRPRGAMTAGVGEPSALMEIGVGGRLEPNVPATVQELYDGLVATSQHRWPSLEFDIGAVNSLAASVFVAGFYYKTFMWPKSFWEKVYEPIIRRAAGLGRASYEPDPDRYEKANAHCDVLVIGSGPGRPHGGAEPRPGRRARHPGRRGGAVRRRAAGEQDEIDGGPALAWAERVVERTPVDARGPADAAHHRLRLVRRQCLRRAGAGEQARRQPAKMASRSSATGRSAKARGAGRRQP
jgi:methylglutamate dehydrogenase subunit C